jgi:hypothetical protein
MSTRENRTPLLLVVLASCCLLVRGAAAHEPPDAIRLTYEGPPGCPDQTALVARIQARLPLRIALENEPAPLFAVVVHPRGDILLGQVASTTDTGEVATREVTGANCNDVIDALALIVTMALGPSPVPDVVADQAGSASAGKSGSSGIAAIESPGNPELPPEPERPEAATDTRRAAEYRLAASLQGSLTVGYVPAALPGTGARVQLLRRRGEHLGAQAVAVGLSAIPSTERGLAEGRAKLSWTVGQLSLCPASLSLSGSMSLLACGRLDIGSLRAEGDQIAHPRTKALLWSSLGAEAEMSWVPIDPLIVGGQAAVLFPLTSYRFVFDPDTVAYGAPRVGLSVSLSAGVLIW